MLQLFTTTTPTRSPRHAFTEAARCTIENAMHAAAVKYDECAASMRQEAERLAAIQTPSAAATTMLQLADVFDAQARDVRQVAATLADAATIVVETE